MAMCPKTNDWQRPGVKFGGFARVTNTVHGERARLGFQGMQRGLSILRFRFLGFARNEIWGGRTHYGLVTVACRDESGVAPAGWGLDMPGVPTSAPHRGYRIGVRQDGCRVWMPAPPRGAGLRPFAADSVMVYGDRLSREDPPCIPPKFSRTFPKSGNGINSRQI